MANIFNSNLLYNPFFYCIILGVVLALLATTMIREASKASAGVSVQSGENVLTVIQRFCSFYNLDCQVVVHTGTGNIFHYTANTLYVSQAVASTAQLYPMGLLLHEAGHAYAFAKNPVILRVRNFISFCIRLCSVAALPLFIVSLVFSWTWGVQIALVVYAVSVLFSLFVIPLEAAANKYALNYINQTNDFLPQELALLQQLFLAQDVIVMSAVFQPLGNMFRYLKPTLSVLDATAKKPDVTDDPTAKKKS